MPLTTAMKNLMIERFRTEVTHVSLHSGDPGTTGANEISGGSPAYARKAENFAAAASGETATAADLTFDVPAATVAHVGYWTALTGGTFLGSDPVTNEVFAAQGQYVVKAGTKVSLTDV